MTTDPKTIVPGFYWYMPFEPGVAPHPCEAVNLDPGERRLIDKDKSVGLVLYYIGEGWYEPLEEALGDGDLIPLSMPERKR